jgi:hypothetical protein
MRSSSSWSSAGWSCRCLRARVSRASSSFKPSVEEDTSTFDTTRHTGHGMSTLATLRPFDLRWAFARAFDATIFLSCLLATSLTCLRCAGHTESLYNSTPSRSLNEKRHPFCSPHGTWYVLTQRAYWHWTVAPGPLQNEHGCANHCFGMASTHVTGVAVYWSTNSGPGRKLAHDRCMYSPSATRFSARSTRLQHTQHFCREEKGGEDFDFEEDFLPRLAERLCGDGDEAAAAVDDAAAAEVAAAAVAFDPFLVGVLVSDSASSARASIQGSQYQSSSPGGTLGMW